MSEREREMQRDLRLVHDGYMTADRFRVKWPGKVPTDQMVEFLKNRRAPYLRLHFTRIVATDTRISAICGECEKSVSEDVESPAGFGAVLVGHALKCPNSQHPGGERR